MTGNRMCYYPIAASFADWARGQGHEVGRSAQPGFAWVFLPRSEVKAYQAAEQAEQDRRTAEAADAD